MRHLPSLVALRAFEAAARTGSFTAAARELAMSQAAVSYQVKRLETELSLTLFLRRNRRVELTDDGAHLSRTISRAFDLIEGGLCRMGSPATLAITTTSSFANLWLAPRIGDFRRAHPEIDLRIEAADAMRDLGTGEFDLAIRHGDGRWPPLAAEKLFDTEFTPMCSPRFLERLPKPPAPADLFAVDRIGPQDPWWAIWFRDAGLGSTGPLPGPGIRLTYQTECMAAAIAGHGVALLSLPLARQEIADGRLVCPWPVTAHDGGAYWIAFERERRLDARLVAFRRWITQAAAEASATR